MNTPVWPPKEYDWLHSTCCERNFYTVTKFLQKEAFLCTKIPKRNWLKESNVKFSPVKINKFIVTSSFFANSVNQDRFSLTIDASLAFGTGHHVSTKFCLELIQELKKRGINPLTVIDVGCGTGILAIAIAKLFGSRVIAVDNDIHSVQMTKRNIVINKVTCSVKAYKSAGLVGNFLNSRAKYNLIVANILYKPIKNLMRSVTINLSNGGFLILSGLNVKQAMHLKEISKPALEHHVKQSMVIFLHDETVQSEWWLR